MNKRRRRGDVDKQPEKKEEEDDRKQTKLVNFKQIRTYRQTVLKDKERNYRQMKRERTNYGYLISVTEFGTRPRQWSTQIRNSNKLVCAMVGVQNKPVNENVGQDQRRLLINYNL